VGEIGQGVGDALKNAKSADEAVQLMNDYTSLVGALGMDARDPAAIGPLMDAFKDRGLQDKFKDSVVGYHNGLAAYMSHTTQVSPGGNFYTRYISGTMGKMQESAAAHHKSTQDFVNRVNSGAYANNPEKFVKDYMSTRTDLQNLQSEAEAFARDTNAAEAP